MHPTLNIAIRAARNAGNVIVRHVGHIDSLNITSKGYNDFVSEVDGLAEAEIINVLRKAYPDHGILAEEGGKKDGSDYQWIIDPLDGTTNFLHGFPQFAVSIALQHKNKMQQAVVYDPLRQELFTATHGSGAFLNDRRIRVSKAKGLEGTLIGTGFPFKHPEHLDAYLVMFKTLHLQTAGIRRAGAASLDLAYVASGRLDGFWEIGLKPWDMAAGVLLIQEAGGLVSDFGGGNEFLETGNIVAGTPKVFKKIIQNIQPHLTSSLKK
ncbi:MAG TPA: inositol-1-monophosphatase [Gammaproteobacteria bacterium]